MTANTHDVVVLGAGPAGLGAAYRCAQAGRRVCVLEREDHLGGLASSFEVAGQRVDHGSHRLHPSTPPPILALLHDLLGDDLQPRPRNGRIRMAGTFVAFPPRPAELVRRLPLSLSARLVRDLVTSRGRHARRDTFDEVVRASLGPTMTERFYAPYVEKLFGVPAAGLSGELARRRVGTRSGAELLRRALRPGGARRGFFYPRRGFGQIPDALAEVAARAGADIRTGCEVVALEAHRDAVTVRTAGGDELRAPVAFSTLPAPLLARLAGAPADVIASGNQLEMRAMVLVYLALAQPQWTPYDAHYFPETDVPMSRISEPKNYRDSADDPRAVTVLCAEIPCSMGDAMWQHTDADLAALVRGALARAELPTPAPVEVVVRRLPRVYPVYRVGYEAPFDVVDAWASGVPRLLHFGRQGLFAHDNTHHALAMAWAAADALRADGTIDRDAWAAARAVFATHVVED